MITFQRVSLSWGNSTIAILAGPILTVLGVLIFAPSSMAAESFQMKQLQVSGYASEMRSDICPSNPQTVSPLPRQQDVCGGDGTRPPPCAANANSGCGPQFIECVRQFNDDLAVVNSYNAWVNKCRSSQKRSAPAPSAVVPPGQSNDFASRIATQAKKAAEAPDKTKAFKAQIQKEETAAINQRGEELETIKRKDQAAQEAADKARSQAKEIEAANNQRDMQNAAKLHCFTGSGIYFYKGHRIAMSGGASDACTDVCRVEMPYSECRSMCKESYAGGRACFKEP